MSKIDELQKRVEHLETEVELLKELVKLQNKSSHDWYIPVEHPVTPQQPISPWYKEPTLEPPYKFTSKIKDDYGETIKKLEEENESQKQENRRDIRTLLS